MALCPNNAIDKKLAKMYAEKMTVNLENRSTLDPEDFWKTMQMIAVNLQRTLCVQILEIYGVFPISLVLPEI